MGRGSRDVPLDEAIAPLPRRPIFRAPEWYSRCWPHNLEHICAAPRTHRSVEVSPLFGSRGPLMKCSNPSCSNKARSGHRLCERCLEGPQRSVFPLEQAQTDIKRHRRFSGDPRRSRSVPRELEEGSLARSRSKESDSPGSTGVSSEKERNHPRTGSRPRRHTVSCPLRSAHPTMNASAPPGPPRLSNCRCSSSLSRPISAIG